MNTLSSIQQITAIKDYFNINVYRQAFQQLQVFFNGLWRIFCVTYLTSAYILMISWSLVSDSLGLHPSTLKLQLFNLQCYRINIVFRSCQLLSQVLTNSADHPGLITCPSTKKCPLVMDKDTRKYFPTGQRYSFNCHHYSYILTVKNPYCYHAMPHCMAFELFWLINFWTTLKNQLPSHLILYLQLNRITLNQKMKLLLIVIITRTF